MLTTVDRRHVCEADGCDRPTPNPVCGDHFTELLRSLRGIGGLTADLRITATRQARSRGSGDASTDAGLAFAWNAADLYWTTVTTLRIWATDVADLVHAMPAYPARPAHVAGWLIAHRAAVRHLDGLAQFHDETTWLARTIRTAVYGPGPLNALGPCTVCGRGLYAARGQAAITCPGCRVVVDVPARRDELLAVAREQLLTAAELSRVMPELLAGQLTELKVDRIYQWARRGRLVQRPGRRYRVGDVLDLLTDGRPA